MNKNFWFSKILIVTGLIGLSILVVPIVIKAESTNLNVSLNGGPTNLSNTVRTAVIRYRVLNNGVSANCEKISSPHTSAWSGSFVLQNTQQTTNLTIPTNLNSAFFPYTITLRCTASVGGSTSTSTSSLILNYNAGTTPPPSTTTRNVKVFVQWDDFGTKQSELFNKTINDIKVE